jgi:hypothetical protein
MCPRIAFGSNGVQLVAGVGDNSFVEGPYDLRCFLFLFLLLPLSL